MLALLKEKKWLFIIIGALLLLIIAAAAAWFLYLKPAREAEALKAAQPPPPLHKKRFESLYALDPVEVPISGRMGARTLTVGLSFRLDSGMLLDEITLRSFEIQDGVSLLLADRSVEELEKNENRIRLKYDILRLVNGLMETGRVRGVYITKFLIL